MDDNVTVKVSFPLDKSGMIGRECPTCKKYFKLKPGTGLPISECNCPYCGHRGESNEFFTQAQIDYAMSYAANQVLSPHLAKLNKSLKNLERTSNKSFIKIKVTGFFNIPIINYSESDLETNVICDNCGLHFAIYGVFAGCPDCKKLNTLSVFRKSLEVARKKLALLDNPTVPTDLTEPILKDVLSSCVSAFDGLGKRLRVEHPTVLPSQPRNLFQNLDALDKVLNTSLFDNLEKILGQTRYKHMYQLFQVRHIWEHNSGVIDNDFIQKTKSSPSLLGRKYNLSKQEVEDFIGVVEDAGIQIQQRLAPP